MICIPQQLLKEVNWAGHKGRTADRGVYRVFVEKPDGKRAFERSRRR
jgi:hypothetical protein